MCIRDRHPCRQNRVHMTSVSPEGHAYDIRAAKVALKLVGAAKTFGAAGGERENGTDVICGCHLHGMRLNSLGLISSCVKIKWDGYVAVWRGIVRNARCIAYDVVVPYSGGNISNCFLFCRLLMCACVLCTCMCANLRRRLITL